MRQRRPPWRHSASPLSAGGVKLRPICPRMHESFIRLRRYRHERSPGLSPPGAGPRRLRPVRGIGPTSRICGRLAQVQTASAPPARAPRARAPPAIFPRDCFCCPAAARGRQGCDHLGATLALGSVAPKALRRRRRAPRLDARGAAFAPKRTRRRASQGVTRSQVNTHTEEKLSLPTRSLGREGTRGLSY